MFILPESITSVIEKLLRGFLWCQGELIKGKARVSWDAVCLPKEEGGLGIKSLFVWNIALMTNHIWSVFSNKKSLWVNWIHEYHLLGRSFWEVKVPSNASWSWRKLLCIREKVRPFFVSRLGDGRDSFPWFDQWSKIGNLTKLIYYRQISNAGFRLQDNVADIQCDNRIFRVSILTRAISIIFRMLYV